MTKQRFAECLLEIERLREQGDWQRLLAFLESDERWEGRSVRRAAIAALEQLHPVGAIPALLPLVDDPDQSVRTGVTKALTATGDHGVLPVLVHVAEHDPAIVTRQWAIFGIARTGGTESVPALRRLVRADDRRIRRAVIEALPLIGGSEAEALLKSLADERDWRLELYRRRALRRLRKGIAKP